MAVSPLSSALYGQLFPTGEVGKLFTDTAEIRALLLVEGNLAKVQGKAGLIPETAAQAIARAAMEVQLDPAALAGETGRNGVNLPGLVAAFRAEMKAPEHAQFVHWGATSQDIIDTGLMLRMRQGLRHLETDLRDVLSALAALAETHADLPMAARTWGQHATPTSFGAVAAGWGEPLLALQGDLDGLRESCLLVSLSGAAGTSAELGPDPAALRADLAAALGLGDPGRGWHTDRAPVLRLADWMTRLGAALSKMGGDLSGLAMTGIGEVALDGAGGSSTMPQKQNPVAAETLVALAHYAAGLNTVLHSGGVHAHQRGGAAMFTEWLALPQLACAAAAGLQVASALAAQIRPASPAMAAALSGGLGMIHAEALSFALAAHMPRPEAQAAVKALCKQALETGTPLPRLAETTWPDADLSAVFDPAQQMGTAPADARAFASRVRALPERAG
jgi:3-carboxy-cis,cis-muconate cycloisomerase